MIILGNGSTRYISRKWRRMAMKTKAVGYILLLVGFEVAVLGSLVYQSGPSLMLAALLMLVGNYCMGEGATSNDESN